MRRSALLALVLPLVVACGGAASTPQPSPLGGTRTVVSLPDFEIGERLEAPSLQFRSDGHIVAATACHELLLLFTLDGDQVSVGELEVTGDEPDCTQRERPQRTIGVASDLPVGSGSLLWERRDRRGLTVPAWVATLALLTKVLRGAGSRVRRRVRCPRQLPSHPRQP